MPPATYIAPKLKPEQADALAQGEFNFLLGGRKWFTTSQAAKAIGREDDFVRELLDQGRLEAHQDSAFGTVKSSRITRRSLLIYLASTANYEPAGYNSWLDAMVDDLNGTQLERVIARATERRRKLP